jgi:hypothetical protein
MQGLMQALSWLAIAASLATSYGHGRWHYLAHRYQPGNARPHITMFAFLGFIGTVMALVWLAMFVWQGPWWLLPLSFPLAVFLNWAALRLGSASVQQLGQPRVIVEVISVSDRTSLARREATPVRVARSLADYRRQLARRQWWRVTAVLAVSYLPLLVLYTVYDAVQSWP